jgi:hypothetical protein
MVTFELAPEDEAEFNDIYDNDYIPTIVTQRDQACGIIRAPERSEMKTAHCCRHQAALHDG